LALYGLHVRNVDEADFEWFRTEEALEPGSYMLGRHADGPNVYLSESIPGLIMMVEPIIQEAEDEGRDALASPGISAEDRRRLEEKHTEGLLSQLTETSSIWKTNPKWVRELKSA
jgi:hypothetical protein